MTLLSSRSLKFDPYLIFFPASIAGALLSVGIWIPFSLQFTGLWQMSYPNWLHAYGVFSLFVFPAIVGFLLTAVPRFTATAMPGIWSVSALFASICTAFAGFLSGSLLFIKIGFTATVLLLTLNVIIRFIRSEQKQPVFLFLYLVPGLCFAVFGSILSFFDSMQQVASAFIFYASPLLIIMGAGSRILLTIQSSGFDDRNDWRRSMEQDHLLTILTALLLAGSFLVEAALALNWLSFEYSRPVLAILRAFLIGLWLVRMRMYAIQWKRVISVMVSGSVFFIFLGFLLTASDEGLSRHLAHFFFVGGLSSVIFAVMVRVILSHGQMNLDYENTSKILMATFSLLILAAATRATAHMLLSGYSNHLGYASFVFLIAVVLWSSVFLYKMIRNIVRVS